MPPLTTGQFARIAAIAYDRWGLSLSEKKQQLVTSRMIKYLRPLPYDSLDDFLDHIEDDPTEAELLSFFDILSTNVTSFYREPAAFSWLERELWTPLARGTITRPDRQVTVWSAACSSGNEPYTMAIEAAEHLGDTNIKVRILATDLATSVLKTAKEGLYEEKSMSGISSERRERWFTREGDAWRIKPELRKMVTFRRVNLVEEIPFHGPFDAIFCRNVMIYFDRDTRQGVVSQLERLLRPGGALIVGSSESLSGLETGLAVSQPAVYVR